MKFLLTNDDGYTAPGLEALYEIASTFGEVITVAPKRHLSGCSHQYSMNCDVELIEQSPNLFSCDAFPADCVRIAISTICEDVDWVLSGVNQGGNLGTDLFVSGTAAGAREAVFFQKPSVAFSNYRIVDSLREWDLAIELGKRVLEILLESEHDPNTFYNVNFPDGLTPSQRANCQIIQCELDLAPLPYDYSREGNQITHSGSYHLRERSQGKDIDVCMSGNVSLSKIRLA